MLDNKLKCKICNQEFSKIDCVTRHAKMVHKIEPKEYYDRYFKTEDEGKCKCCGTETKYWNLEHGYREFCSRSCFWKVTTQLDSVKEKRKQTCEKKYNSANYMQSQDFKEKSEQTNLREYGIKNAGGSIQSVKKIKATKLERYGDEKYNNCNKIQKEQETLSKFQKLLPTINVLNYTDKIFQCNCKICNRDFSINYQTLVNRIFTFKTNPCIYCNPITSYISNEEKNLVDFIKTYCTDIVENDRTILRGGHELDIFLPNKKLAFEFDGLYWHSELHKDKNYHLQKTEECERKGIQLIHIFEDEWIYKQDIVKSRIMGLLGLNKRVFARKCIIKNVSYKEAEKFLNKCHIQGNCMSSYRYGLYYDDKLVSLMTFGKSRFNKNEYEILRYCNALNINVVGGASRLFAYFLKDHPEINEVISFADRRWSIGNLYEQLEFNKVDMTKPSYYYIIDGIRHNRVEFQKHKLVNEGFSPDMTEHEIMLSRKIYRIYDCGNLKYKYTRISG